MNQASPVIVRGVDLLGQPFEERTSTLNVNFHGCRYASRHHLPRNAWVTVEGSRGDEHHSVRARVAWIQPPVSVREYFQIAVEFENPCNIWLDSPPGDWGAREQAERLRTPAENGPQHPQVMTMEERGGEASTHEPVNRSDEGTADLDIVSSSAENPLLRELKNEIDQQARRSMDEAARGAVERIELASQGLDRARAAADEAFFARWRENFRQTQAAELENLSATIKSRQNDFAAGVHSEIEGGVQKAREAMHELESRARDLASESARATEALSRLAEIQRHLEESARQIGAQAEAERREKSPDEISEDWRRRLQDEMKLAQAQWSELLQSSIDSSMNLLVARLSDRSQEVFRAAEDRLSEKLQAIQRPLERSFTDTRETLATLKSSLAEEVARASSSLVDMEQSARTMKDYSDQLETLSHDTLNDLHGRLEKVVDAQTQEMNRRVETLATQVPEQLSVTLKAIVQELVERASRDVEARLAPHFQRLPELARELSAREVQIEESLRLHRERLRQLSENNQREVVGQIETAAAGVRGSLQEERERALAHWGEQLDATGARAAAAASDAIGKSSEWLQHEAQARLQVLVEQAIGAAGTGFEEKSGEMRQIFGGHLERQISQHSEQVRAQLDSLGDEVAGRTRSQLDAAAEQAAASFGEVLRGISGQEIEKFVASSRAVISDRHQELGQVAQDFRTNLEAIASSATENFGERIARQIEVNVSDGRSRLDAEATAFFEGIRNQTEVRQQEWAGTLDSLGEEANRKHQERLRLAVENSVLSSVRKLNEHGQIAIESLKRSADQALRESCAKVLEGVVEMLRELPPASSEAPGFAPNARFEPPPDTSGHQSHFSGNF